MAEGRVSLDELRPLVEEASSRFGVPTDYVWNVIRAENSGSVEGAKNLKAANANAISPANARGVMQVTPVAVKDVQEAGLIPSNVDHRNLSLKDQINIGTAYLSRLMKLSDKPEEIYAMYNYGPKARNRMADLPRETSDYVSKATGTRTVQSTGGGGTGTFGGGMLTSGDLVGQLFAAMQGQNTAMQSAAQDMSAVQQRASSLQAQSVAEQQAVVQSAASNAAAKANIDYSVAKTLETLQSMFNMDVGQANNEIAASLTAAQEAKAARAPVRAAYDQLASISFMDNPIGYLFAQMQLPSLAEQNNALADREDLALNNIREKTQMLGAAKQVVSANVADSLQQVQRQSAENEARMAQARLKQEEAKNLSGDAAAAMQRIQLANAMGDNQRSTLSTIISLEDRQEARELRNMQLDEFRAGKKLKEEEDLRLNQRLKVISDTLGFEEPMTTARLRNMTNKKEQEVWLSAATSGQLGEDLMSSLQFFAQGNRAKLRTTNPVTVAFAERLGASGAQYQSGAAKRLMAANGGKPAKPEEIQKAAYKDYEEDVVSSMSVKTNPEDLGSAKWDQVFNPYKAQFLGFNKAIEMDQRYAGLKNNLVKTAIDTLQASGSIKGDNLTAEQQQQVIVSVVDQVGKRNVTAQKAAADIAAYFKTAAAYNQDTGKYGIFSLPPQTAYLFTLNGTFGDDNRRKMDLMDPKDVENTLIWRARKAVQPIGYSPIGGFR